MFVYFSLPLDTFIKPAIGAAFMAGLGSGFFSSLDEISNAHTIAKNFHPKMNQNEARKLYKGWEIAVKSAIKFKN